jgi:hypothetical protein
MFFVKFISIVIFAEIFIANGSEILTEKLNKLLDFCISNPDRVDDGTVLGVVMAKGMLKDDNRWRILTEKCEIIEKINKKSERKFSDFSNLI